MRRTHGERQARYQRRRGVNKPKWGLSLDRMFRRLERKHPGGFGPINSLPAGAKSYWAPTEGYVIGVDMGRDA